MKRSNSNAKVIFLDRDGVINKFPGYGAYVTKVKDFHFLPGALEAIKDLTQSGFTIFVVSNQAGISRGVYSQDKLNRINQRMLNEVKKFGGKIKKVFYCTHLPDEKCGCRKPQIGSVKEALYLVKKSMKKIDSTYFVGDVQSDIETGRRAGCKTIFVLSGKEDRRTLRKWKVKPHIIVKDLLAASKIILNENSRHTCFSRGRAH